MPRRAKGPRLWLLKRGGREPTWLILDGGKQHSTGCGEGDRAGAERALGRYIAEKYQPPTRESALDRILIADVMTVYLKEHAPHVRNPEFLLHTSTPVIDWWGGKTLAEIRGQTCREYVEWRCKRGVSDQTARHDLKTLRAAINYYHREYGPLSAVPSLTMPAKGQPKDRWLTRSEAARLLWAARRHQRLARFILIGLYTGTRRSAIEGLKWTPSLTTGYFDLNAGVMHRMGRAQEVTAKRQPPCRIPDGLMPHLRRWAASDLAKGWADVCHLQGKQSGAIRKSFNNAVARAGLEGDVTPHTLRHTTVTWLMQRGVPAAEVAGFVGMTIDMVDRIYGHHHPDHMRRASARRPTIAND